MHAQTAVRLDDYIASCTESKSQVTLVVIVIWQLLGTSDNAGQVVSPIPTALQAVTGQITERTLTSHWSMVKLQ